ncbi:S8 family serine peptidase (plasmid) [Tundrisphaera lichenicola]|uniref:golvesin C-terminal-like domain-containing protein n=1 Tax=Tundrisphaera lichenicola TaxID=2029860 RepID=UPI003EBFE656
MPIRIVVGFEAGGPSVQTRSSIAAMGANLSQTWFDGRLGLVTFAGSSDAQAALAKLRILPRVTHAEADVLMQNADFLPNDPLFPSQWGLKNNSGVDVNATAAWDQTTGNSTTLVAVLDTGVDYTHPDLYLNIAINQGEIPASLRANVVDTNGNGLVDFYDLNSLDGGGHVVLGSSGNLINSWLTTDQNENGFIDAGDLRSAPWSDNSDGDGNGLVDDLTGWDYYDSTNNVIDTYGHGTHVAGILGARGNNAVGVAGVNWNARILPVKIHDGNGVATSDAIAAIQYAVSQGASVINASWGTFTDVPALKDAIALAGDAGVVVVAAAGNHSNDIGNPSLAYYPASYNLPNLISVASVDTDGSLSSFSNYGRNTVSLAAPGSNIVSTWPGGGYFNYSGTSMATPYVTGVISLLAGVFPGASASWLVDRVLSTVKPLASLTNLTITGGIVDAFSAINAPNIAGPRLVSSSPNNDVSGSQDRVSVRFDRPIQANTFTINDVVIAGPSGPIIPLAIERINDLEFNVVFAPQTALGSYSLMIGPAITDLTGRSMDQDRDGNPGEVPDDRYTTGFRIVAAPAVRVVDDGDAGFSATPGWQPYAGAGWLGDMRFKVAGTGSESAAWTFNDLAPGRYRVSVTWVEYSNRASDAHYVVSVDGSARPSVAVDQRQAPSGFSEGGRWWQDLGSSYDVSGGSLSVRLSDLAGPAGSYLVADAVRVERIADLSPSLPTGPVVIDDGDAGFSATSGWQPYAGAGWLGDMRFKAAGTGAESASWSFGDLAPGRYRVSVTWVEYSNRASDAHYVVAVDGSARPSVAVDQRQAPVGFSEGGRLWQDLGSSYDVSGGSLSVRLSDLAGPAGSYLVADAVRVERIADLPPTGPVVIDDGDAGFSATPGWQPYAGAGWLGDMRFKAAGTGSESAAWTFNDLAPGRYRVSVTWVSDGNRVSNAPYTVIVDGSARPSVAVDQRQAPVGFSEGGRLWQDLGSSYDVSGGSLSVRLSDLAGPAGSYLVADAVRVERIADLPPTGPVVIDDGDAGFSATPGWQPYAGAGWLGDMRFKAAGTGSESAAWTFNDLAPGRYRVSVTWVEYSNRASDAHYVVAVDGSARPSVAVDQRQAPVGFSEGGRLWQDLGSSYDVSGGSLSVRLSDLAGPAGSYLVADAVRVERIADLPPTGPVVIDDGDAGFSATPGWQPYAGAGWLGDMRFKAAGTGSESAAWTFNDLAPGRYRVSVTWVSDGNRVSNAPYTVIVDGSARPSVAVDQRQAPVGFSEGGRLWQDLGSSYDVSGGSLSVRLSDLAGPAGSYLVADAVRVERIADLPPTGPVVIDDGDAGFSATSGWQPYAGAGWLGDMRFKAAGTGAESASWSFGDLAPGRYRVSVTWVEYSNRASDAPYTVIVDGAAGPTLTIDQRQAPVGFSEGGRLWQDLGGSFDVTGGSLLVRLSDLAGPAGSYLVADAVRVERIADLPPAAPDVAVFEGGVSVDDGLGTVDFGRTDVGVPLTRTFKVQNVGTSSLDLGVIEVPAGFSITAGFDALTLAPGASTSFTLRLNGAVLGSYQGIVRFATNDPDEDPFEFTVTGVASEVRVIDDGDAGFSATSGWQSYAGAGWQGDMKFKSSGTGAESASWSFGDLAPGRYRVSVTWVDYSNRASDALYTVLVDGAAGPTLTIDQRQAPVGFSEGGRLWQDLGGSFDVTGGSLLVRLSDLAGPAGSYLVADAVRVERIAELTSGLELSGFANSPVGVISRSIAVTPSSNMPTVSENWDMILTSESATTAPIMARGNEVVRGTEAAGRRGSQSVVLPGAIAPQDLAITHVPATESSIIRGRTSPPRPFALAGLIGFVRRPHRFLSTTLEARGAKVGPENPTN